jgi:hypothetical protein
MGAGKISRNPPRAILNYTCPDMAKKHIQAKLSLAPLKFEDAVSAFLKVKPEPKKPSKKQTGRKSE